MQTYAFRQFPSSILKATRLRTLANTLLVPVAEQSLFGGAPSEKEISVGKKYDRIIQRLVDFISSSFDKDDLEILAKVVRFEVSVNIEKIDQISASLQKIKKAMVEAQSKKELLST